MGKLLMRTSFKLGEKVCDSHTQIEHLHLYVNLGKLSFFCCLLDFPNTLYVLRNTDILKGKVLSIKTFTAKCSMSVKWTFKARIFTRLRNSQMPNYDEEAEAHNGRPFKIGFRAELPLFPLLELISLQRDDPPETTLCLCPITRVSNSKTSPSLKL